MMKKFCKVGFCLVSVFISSLSIASCGAIKELEILAPNTTTICKPHLEVFFGYNTQYKSPSWGIYKMKASLAAKPPVYLRSTGTHVPVAGVKSDEQLKPSQIIASGQSKALLIPHYNVLSHAAQVNEFITMANVFPAIKADWQGLSRDMMFKLGANEREMALKKGDYMVLSGVVYHETLIKGVPSAKYIYKVYYHDQYDYTLSYLIPVKPKSQELNDYITSIKCIELVSGHKLFSGFSDTVRNSILDGVAYSNKHWVSPNGKEGVCVLIN
jgi:hypothetical protein